MSGESLPPIVDSIAREHPEERAGNNLLISSWRFGAGLVGGSGGSPDPAVFWIVGLPPGSGWRPSVGQVARSGDLATTGVRHVLAIGQPECGDRRRVDSAFGPVLDL